MSYGRRPLFIIGVAWYLYPEKRTVNDKDPSGQIVAGHQQVSFVGKMEVRAPSSALSGSIVS